MRNPFFNDETESYKVEEIYDWFVGEETLLSQLYKPKHHFICGDRGTGKSMLMRYLEPYCQFKANGGWKKFLKKDNSFISFYIPIPKNIININEFKSQKLPVPESIFAHYFNMLMTESIIHTMKTQLNQLPMDMEVKNIFVEEFIKMLNPLPESITSVDCTVDRENSPFEWILAFIENEKNRIMNFINYFSLRRIEYTGSLSDYHTFVLPFIRLIKKLYSLDRPIYLLIDDAGNIFEFQQRIFNSWIANRDHDDLSIKISTVISYYKTFLTISGDFIDGKNDFQYIHLDNYGSKSDTLSARELKNIINKRLIESGISLSADELFSTSESQEKLIEQARLNAQELANTNKIKDKKRYVSRYTMREFYKILSESTTNKRISVARKYCGINDIISFSSYNIRDCLKTCSTIFEEVYPNCETLLPESIEPINADIQDTIMNKLSKAEIVGITLFKEHYDVKIINRLKQLIISLGNLYRSNLLNFEYSENGVTAFQTEMEKLTDEERETIKIGVEQRYFLRRFYSDKDGTTINTAYALNKMFFPYFKLELSPFAGRLKIKYDLLKDAFYTPKSFKDKMETKLSISENTNRQLTLFDIEELEDDIDEIKNNISELL